jgi:hypothetical protein
MTRFAEVQLPAPEAWGWTGPDSVQYVRRFVAI